MKLDLTARAAFTLLELLCVVAVMTVLTALSLMAYSKGFHRSQKAIEESSRRHQDGLRRAIGEDNQ